MAKHPIGHLPLALGHNLVDLPDERLLFLLGQIGAAPDCIQRIPMVGTVKSVK